MPQSLKCSLMAPASTLNGRPVTQTVVFSAASEEAALLVEVEVDKVDVVEEDGALDELLVVVSAPTNACANEASIFRF